MAGEIQFGLVCPPELHGKWNPDMCTIEHTVQGNVIVLDNSLGVVVYRAQTFQECVDFLGLKLQPMTEWERDAFEESLNDLFDLAFGSPHPEGLGFAGRMLDTLRPQTS